MLAGVALHAAAAAAAPLYVRGALGWERGEDTTIADLDCTATSPPALFGCGSGADGLPLGARGDFAAGPLAELALGAELGPRLRLELALAARRGLDLEAAANFRGVAGAQPVRAAGRSTAALLVLVAEAGDPGLRARPFVAVGVGAARNEVDAVTYWFPSLGEGALTRVRGGARDDLAWSAAAGVALRLAPRLHLDLDLRYTDLGEVRTEAGTATIVRPNRTLELEIAGTRGELATAGAAASLRWRFGG